MFNYDNDYRYSNRNEAGQILADKLMKYKGGPGIVLAIPRGGVPVGYVIAKELGFDLDIVLTKKIGHPLQSEYAIGAVSMTERIVVPHPEVPGSYIEEETLRIRERLKQMYRDFNGDREPAKLTGKIAVLVDDGIATGNTIATIIDMVKKQSPTKTIIAVPVASRQAIDKLSPQVDEMICPLVPEYFTGVGAYYYDFEQTSDDEVKTLLNKFRKSRME
ncbi:MAG: phosphoribosyltransferase [Taibaiella sp.]|nr:phosphoribosyltransferase [Taibaiella sp.]